MHILILSNERLDFTLKQRFHLLPLIYEHSLRSCYSEVLLRLYLVILRLQKLLHSFIENILGLLNTLNFKLCHFPKAI